MKYFALFATIGLVAILTLFLLITIWIPDVVSGEVILKLILTYLVLITGVSVVMKMLDYLRFKKTQEVTKDERPD